jgi:Kdo2-lipid IVA lauroyltransferase/acyltransferase
LRKLRFAIEAAAFDALLQMARWTPRWLLLRTGSTAGTIGRAIDRRHVRIARENLRLAYGASLPEREAKRIVAACWRHFGKITFDSLAFPRRAASDAGSLVRYEGLEHIRAAYDRGKGVLLFSGHYGSWELVALMQGFLGMRLALVTRPLDNPELETMLARLRGGSGNTVVHKRRAVREMIKTLHDGGGVAIVIDQDARGDGVFVPFFGVLASTTPTLALLALRTGAAVVPVVSTLEEDGTYRVAYEPEIPVVPTGDRDADVLRLTAACTASIERWVRARPEQWLWMHRRWKTRPSPLE